jgi:hypothetical protein
MNKLQIFEVNLVVSPTLDTSFTHNHTILVSKLTGGSPKSVLEIWKMATFY